MDIEERYQYLRRKHDAARPPLDRLLTTHSLSAAQQDTLQAARAALNPLQERRALQQELAHLFAYASATAGRTENIFETLTYPDLFLAAQAALETGNLA
ncbi:MAG: hypothetical protein K8R89_00065 [Anaerolineae bacterium]|nr:hypothetical protein [Anaerolineae bacterium]